MTSSWVAIGAVVILLIASMAALSAMARRGGASSEAARKLLHVEMGLVTLGFPWLFAAPWPVALLAAVSIAWFRALRQFPWLAARFGTVLEVRRSTHGEAWFACGVLLAFLASAGDRSAYCIAILVLTFADSAAAFVGTRWGRTRRLIGGARKSLAGSGAFFAVAFVMVSLVLAAIGAGEWDAVFRAAMLVALATTLVEALLGRGLDNLFIPACALAALELAATAPIPMLGALVCGTALTLALILQVSRPCRL